MNGRWSLLMLLVGGCVGLLGCLPSQQAPVQGDLRAADTPGRVPALVGSAESGDEGSLRELIHALGDKDPAVRLFAIRSLQERTGQTLGYRYYESGEKRQAAVTRWHAWLDEQETGSEPILSGYDAVPTPVD